MDQQGAVGVPDLKKDRSHAQIGQSAPAVQGDHARQTNGLGRPNGQNGALVNGDTSTSKIPATTNGEGQSAATAFADATDPPPLDTSWRESTMNKSFGKLLTRVSHQCFVDLQETLSAMSAIQIEPQQPRINGVPQTALDTSEASLQKKRLLLDFASNQRDRFIKTLVLADASRNQEIHADLITLRNWQHGRYEGYRFAKDSFMSIKVTATDFKIPSPNTEDAMEVLSAGKVSRIPHLGFVAPEKVSAKEMLRTLRDMDVTIATRLSLNDELSPHMQEYSIANGRVTFRVPGEFEVDLSIADEDPESPYFFLDLRFAFKPSVGAINQTLFEHLRPLVNEALLNKGLPGCYEFLHNFVLTHKINVLRSQVAGLIQGKWFDCIRAENMRRSLTVQYWADRPGPKSWLEFGIGSGKVKGVRSRKSETSCLSFRWFRQGVQTKEQPFAFDWSDLSLERCLSAVIEAHTSWILEGLKTRVTDLAPVEAAAHVQDSEGGLGTKELVFDLASVHAPLSLHLDAVTGMYSISPPSGPTARAERRLNQDPGAEAAQWLANTLCAVAQERVHKIAELLQWTPVPRLARQDDLQKYFGPGVRAHSTFVPRRAWGDRWALTVTFNLSGTTWWASQLAEKRDERDSVISRSISSAQRLRTVVTPRDAGDVSRAGLLEIERSAVAEVSFGALSSQLHDLRVPHHFEKSDEFRSNGSSDSHSPADSRVMLFFEPSTLLRLPKKKRGRIWVDGFARLSHHGMVNGEANSGGVRHEIRLALHSSKMNELQKHLTQFKDRNLVLGEDGAVALRILVPFGRPFAEQLRARLQGIERLERHVMALQTHGLSCTQVSLNRLSFAYQGSPELNATVVFSHDAGRPASLKLQPSDINPHSRIKVLLEEGLNGTEDKGVEAVGFILLLTLPLLQAFDRIEASHKVKQAALILARTSTKYLLKYKSPLPACTFEIRARTKSEGKKRVVLWHIQLKRDGLAVDESFTKRIAQELWQAKGEHWQGIGNAIIAEAMGIGAAMDKLDEFVRGSETAAAPAVAVPAAAQPPAPDAPKPGGSQQASKPQTQGGANGQGAAVKKEQPDVIMLD